jgi:hypothetical protein
VDHRAVAAVAKHVAAAGEKVEFPDLEVFGAEPEPEAVSSERWPAGAAGGHPAESPATHSLSVPPAY